MRWVRFGILIVFMAILQADFVKIISVGSVFPNLLLIAMVFFAINSNPVDAVITSFAIGFAADIINVGHVMGPGMLSYGLFGTLLAHINRMIEIRQMPFEALAIFLSGLCVGVLIIIFSAIRGGTAESIKPMIFGTAVYSGLIGALIFRFFSFVMKTNTNRARR